MHTKGSGKRPSGRLAAFYVVIESICIVSNLTVAYTGANPLPMPRPRAQQVSLEATAYYHCISRCVRRAFLCGQDPLTGQSFDHRKQWLVERMKELAAIFAIDICSYGLLSNHFHVVLHLDRQRALSWTDEQVAERYERIFRHTVKIARHLPAQAWARKVAAWRQRLWD